MKTIKTANGIKKIEDWNHHLVSIQLRTILQEHRATLIEKLISGGLETYIDYKFSMKASSTELERIKEGLDVLKHDGIEITTYGSIFLAVSENDFTTVDNALFYAEIDSRIKATLYEPRLFSGTQPLFFKQWE
jgi:hypothetical protein